METATTHRRAPLAARIAGALPNVLRYALLIYLAFATLCIGFFADQIDYWFGTLVGITHIPWIIIAGAVVGCGLTGGLWALHRRRVFAFLEERKRFAVLTGTCMVVLFIVQLILVSQLAFVVGADSLELVKVTVHELDARYFSIYPHNLFCLGLFALITEAAEAVGASAYSWLVAGGCLAVTLSVGLAALTAHKLMGAPSGVAVLLIGALWLGLSPMAQVPYTDSYGILWPTLTFYAYICVRKPRAKWPLIIAASVIGYFMKAPSLAVGGAIFIVEACRLIRSAALKEHAAMSAPTDTEATDAFLESSTDEVPSRLRRWGIPIALCALSGLLAFGVAQAVKSVPDVEIDPEMEIGVPHYLYMGIGDRLGAYSPSIYESSTSYETRAERNAANIQAWQDRIAQIGANGLGEILLAKMMTTLSNGSFFWGGDDIASISGTNQALLDFYGLTFKRGEPAANLDNPWAWLCQILWMAVLIGCALCLLRRRAPQGETVICVALLLFCIYALIFEANPRYPFIFAPLILMLSVFGWKGLAQRAASVIGRRLAARRAS